MNPTKNPVSKKQQHHNHIQKKRSDEGHFGRNTCNFAIFYKRESEGRINRRRFYSTKDRGFIISKINLRRREKINKGDRICKKKLSITGVEKFIRKIKLIRITDLLFKGRVKRLNKTNIRRLIHGKIKLTKKIRVILSHN